MGAATGRATAGRPRGSRRLLLQRPAGCPVWLKVSLLLRQCAAAATASVARQSAAPAPPPHLVLCWRRACLPLCADDGHGPQHWYPDAHGRPAEVLPKEDVGPHLPPGGWRAGTSQGSRPRTGLATSGGGEPSLLLCISYQAAPVLSGWQMPELPLKHAKLSHTVAAGSSRPHSPSNSLPNIHEKVPVAHR